MGLVDPERPARETLSVERFQDRADGTVELEFNKAEAFRTPGLSVRHDVCAQHFVARVFEERLQRVVVGFVSKVADEQILSHLV